MRRAVERAGVMLVELELVDDDGNELVVEVPAKYVVCGGCAGRGSVLHEAFRGVAFSSEDFREDPDFEEGYFGGLYDVGCPDCGGERVVAVADEESVRWTKEHAEHLARYEERAREDAAFEAVCRAEREMGA